MADAVIIREANPTDCDGLIKLIQELAEYEKMPHCAILDAETLRRDGFGDEKMFRCFVAENTSQESNTLVGLALYFFHYSTWEGVSVYLEDLYVTPNYRHYGIGGKLWQEVARVAVNRKCNRLDWVCLGWNKNSIEFYKSKGAVNLTSDEEWNLFRLTGDNLKRFAGVEDGEQRDMPVKACHNGV